jgi:hypothetical protein
MVIAPKWAARAGAAGLGALERALGSVRDRCADGARVTAFLRETLRFQPRADDVFVATYPRSGTTWMQFLVYLILSDRSLDFEHVSQVTPWYERSLALGTRTAADFAAMASPRVFKSHLRPEWVPSPGRIIYVERDGRDVLVSYFHFYRSHLRFEGTFEAFYERFMRGELQYRSWFDHVEAWRRAARARDVLWMRYEDMRADPGATVDRVAAYLGRTLSAEDHAAVVRMASYDFMKAHESKFDPITEHLIDRRLSPGRFLRAGATGDGKDRLTPRQIERFETRQGQTRMIRRVEPRLADFLH